MATTSDAATRFQQRARPAPAATVVVVGVCGSGKSELVRRLRAMGYAARSVAQEHSHVASLWRHEDTPDAVVYLHALGRTVRRRGRRWLGALALREQRRRLADARRHATVRVRTDRLTAGEVAQRVHEALAIAGTAAGAGTALPGAA